METAIRAALDVRDAIEQAIDQVGKALLVLGVTIEWARDAALEQPEGSERLVYTLQCKGPEESQLEIRLVHYRGYWFPSIADITLELSRHPLTVSQPKLRFRFISSTLDGSLLGIQPLDPNREIDAYNPAVFLQCPRPIFDYD